MPLLPFDVSSPMDYNEKVSYVLIESQTGWTIAPWCNLAEIKMRSLQWDWNWTAWVIGDLGNRCYRQSVQGTSTITWNAIVYLPNDSTLISESELLYISALRKITVGDQCLVIEGGLTSFFPDNLQVNIFLKIMLLMMHASNKSDGSWRDENR